MDLNLGILAIIKDINIIILTNRSSRRTTMCELIKLIIHYTLYNYYTICCVNHTNQIVLSPDAEEEHPWERGSALKKNKQLIPKYTLHTIYNLNQFNDEERWRNDLDDKMCTIKNPESWMRVLHHMFIVIELYILIRATERERRGGGYTSLEKRDARGSCEAKKGRWRIRMYIMRIRKLKVTFCLYNLWKMSSINFNYKTKLFK